MSEGSGRGDDQRVERVIGALLRIGVLLAVLVTLPGGALYLMGDVRGAPDYATAAEWAFRLSLDGVAERIRCPLLVIHAGQDRVIPASEGRRLAQTVPGAELVVYPDGVHVCHNLTYAYRPLAADWMADRLGEAKRAPPTRG